MDLELSPEVHHQRLVFRDINSTIPFKITGFLVLEKNSLKVFSYLDMVVILVM